MKPLIRIANLFIYTSKQVGQINEKHRIGRAAGIFGIY